MNRYLVTSSLTDLSLEVGWDNPLMTYYAIATDLSIKTKLEAGELDEAECDAIVLWVGTNLREILTLIELQAHMPLGVQIPEDILKHLEADADQPYAATPLQNWSRQFVQRNHLDQGTELS